MEKLPTYSPTYSLTYLHIFATRPPLQIETLHLQPFLSLSLEISSWPMLAHLWRKGCGGGTPGGPIPITSIVRSTSAYFNKSTICESVARFIRLNSRLNRVANTYLLTPPQSFVEFDSTSVRTMNVFLVLNYLLKVRI